MEKEKEKTGENLDEEVIILKKKAEIFCDRKIQVHVALKSRLFYNGTIVYPISEDYFMLIDKKIGEVPIFFVQLYDIRPLESKGGEE